MRPTGIAHKTMLPPKAHYSLLLFIWQVHHFSSADLCSFPPRPLGGDFKVLTLFPKKVVKYFCHPGFHLWGSETAECNAEVGWSRGPQCLVDFGLRKLATASSNGLEAEIPLQGKWNTKHSGESCLWNSTLPNF